MTKLYVTELRSFPGPGIGLGGPWPPEAEQAVAIPGNSAPFGVNTRCIRIAADSICSINIGPGVTAATTTQARVAANAAGEYIQVKPGDQIATIVNT